MLGTIHVKNHSRYYIRVWYQSKRNQNTISQYTKQVYMWIFVTTWLNARHCNIEEMHGRRARRGNIMHWTHCILWHVQLFLQIDPSHSTSGVTSHHPPYFQPHHCQLQINLHKKFEKQQDLVQENININPSTVVTILEALEEMTC